MLKESNYLLIIFDQDKRNFSYVGMWIHEAEKETKKKNLNKIEKYINTPFLVKQNFHKIMISGQKHPKASLSKNGHKPSRQGHFNDL